MDNRKLDCNSFHEDDLENQIAKALKFHDVRFHELHDPEISLSNWYRNAWSQHCTSWCKKFRHVVVSLMEDGDFRSDPSAMISLLRLIQQAAISDAFPAVLFLVEDGWGQNIIDPKRPVLGNVYGVAMSTLTSLLRDTRTPCRKAYDIQKRREKLSLEQCVEQVLKPNLDEANDFFYYSFLGLCYLNSKNMGKYFEALVWNATEGRVDFHAALVTLQRREEWKHQLNNLVNKTMVSLNTSPKSGQMVMVARMLLLGAAARFEYWGNAILTAVSVIPFLPKGYYSVHEAYGIEKDLVTFLTKEGGMDDGQNNGIEPDSGAILALCTLFYHYLRHRPCIQQRKCDGLKSWDRIPWDVRRKILVEFMLTLDGVVGVYRTSDELEDLFPTDTGLRQIMQCMGEWFARAEHFQVNAAKEASLITEREPLVAKILTSINTFYDLLTPEQQPHQVATVTTKW